MKKLLILTLLLMSNRMIAQSLNENLYQAVLNNDTLSINQFLKDGGDVNYVKQQGWLKVNLLISAINKKNLEAVAVLLNNGVDVNWIDGFQTTALMYAVDIGNIKLIKTLVDKGANIKHKDKEGNDAISIAKKKQKIGYCYNT